MDRQGQDNGVGIAPEHHERVFGLFKRLHGQETPCAGIGLAMCKKIIEAMGGAIWVESEPVVDPLVFEAENATVAVARNQ